MLTINTNLASIGAVNKMSANSDNLATAMERLSSGRRINSAADDAAGYSVAQSMEKQIRGLDQSVRNVNDGISLTQTAAGAIEEISNMLHRMRELAVQSSSDTYEDTTDRAAMQNEYDALTAEIDRIAVTTKFNGQALLDNAGTLQIQAGWENDGSGNNMIDIVNSDLQTAALGFAGDVSTSAAAQGEIADLDTAIQTVINQAAAYGAVENRLEYTAKNLASVSEKISAAKSRVWDADFASESAALSKANVLQNAGTAMLAQANQQPQQVLQLLR